MSFISMMQNKIELTKINNLGSLKSVGVFKKAIELDGVALATFFLALFLI